MAKTETIHVRVSEQVKGQAEETLSQLGITISEAVNMFLCQVSLTGGLPFAVRLPERVTVNSRDDLAGKLREAEAECTAGSTLPAADALRTLKEKYGL